MKVVEAATGRSLTTEGVNVNQVLAEKVADVIHANSRTNNSARAAHAQMAAELS